MRCGTAHDYGTAEGSKSPI